MLAVRSSATSEAFSVLNAAVQFKAKRGANDFSQKTDEASAEGYFHYYVRSKDGRSSDTVSFVQCCPPTGLGLLVAC